MKPTALNTIFWMVIFAAATFCIIPVTFAMLVFSHAMPDPALEYVLWPLRLVFMASPWVALFLGLRGVLPGTKPLAVTQDRANILSKILAAIVMVIIAVFTLGAWVAFLPPPGRPNISITFLGYTNDATGVRLSLFALTNLNPSTIFVYAPNIEMQSPNDPSDAINYWPGYNQWQQLHSQLDEGASVKFTMIPPTNQSPWRLSCLVYPDRGKSVKNRLKVVVSLSCLSVGVWPLFANFLPMDGAFRHPYNIEGDWIKNAQ